MSTIYTLVDENGVIVGANNSFAAAAVMQAEFEKMGINLEINTL